MKRSFWESVGAFLAGKGFYIVLLLCVTALGVSGYYLFSGLADAGQTVAGPATVIATPKPAAVIPMPPATASPRPVPTVPPAASIPPAPGPIPTKAPQPSAPATATASVFTWPVKGEVLRAWSVETLAYDRTMGDWRVHDGVDIAAAAGTQVLAPAGGTVLDLWQDDLMGTTVSILHAGGVVSTCSNLAAVPSVEIGDPVLTGDVIGAVGQTALAESGEASHLHLSMTCDGVSMDPLDYLPQR